MQTFQTSLFYDIQELIQPRRCCKSITTSAKLWIFQLCPTETTDSEEPDTPGTPCCGPLSSGTSNK